jgi:hypothetical protein
MTLSSFLNVSANRLELGDTLVIEHLADAVLRRAEQRPKAPLRSASRADAGRLISAVVYGVRSCLIRLRLCVHKPAL